MPRGVRSTRRALERLVELTGWAPPAAGTYAHRLAVLAFAVRRYSGAEGVRQEVRWTGQPPRDGIAGWELEALEWFTTAPRRDA